MCQVNNDQTRRGGEHVAERFRTRGRYALAVIAIFGALGTLLITKSVDDIPGPLATYIAGISLCLGAMVMIIGWGASTSHGELAEHATADHQRLYDRLDGRVGGIETYEREHLRVLNGIADEVEAARRRRGR